MVQIIYIGIEKLVLAQPASEMCMHTACLRPRHQSPFKGPGTFEEQCRIEATWYERGESKPEEAPSRANWAVLLACRIPVFEPLCI